MDHNQPMIEETNKNNLRHLLENGFYVCVFFLRVTNVLGFYQIQGFSIVTATPSRIVHEATNLRASVLEMLNNKKYRCLLGGK